MVYVIWMSNGYTPDMTDDYETTLVGIFDNKEIAEENLTKLEEQADFEEYWIDVCELNKILI